MKRLQITRDFMWGSTRYLKGMKGDFAPHIAEAIIKRQLGHEVAEEGYERKDMQAEEAPKSAPKRRTYKRRDRVPKA